MTRRNIMLLAAFGSLALLLGAFGFQMLGYAPCKLCLWQRWPHGAAIALGGLVLILGPLTLLGLAGALAAAIFDFVNYLAGRVDSDPLWTLQLFGTWQPLVLLALARVSQLPRSRLAPK